MDLWSALAAYLAFAALVTVTPGVDNVIVLRFAAAGGRRPALAAGAGICLGCLLWAAASVAGLTAVLASSPVAVTVLRVAGAAYLGWLGVVTLLGARRRPEDGEPAGSAFRVGLLTNVLNPKAGVFFLAVLPRFLPPDRSVPLTASLFVAAHLAMGMLWFVLITAAVGWAGAVLQRPAVRYRLNLAVGVAFLVLALTVAW